MSCYICTNIQVYGKCTKISKRGSQLGDKLDNLYKYKKRRFIAPGSSILTSGDAISSTDPYDGFDEASAIAYNLTGNCPVSISISNLVNELIESEHHDDASYTLTNSASFLGYLLSLFSTIPT